MTPRAFVRLTVLSIAVAGITPVAEGRQEPPPPEVLAYADIVLHNGKVVTADDMFTIAEALAIRDGKILAVGTSDRIRKLAGSKTRQIDLSGKTVTPGFIDTHLHLHNAGGQQTTHSLGADPLKQLKEIVSSTQAGDWILAKTTRREDLLTLKDLDSAAPGNPVVLWLLGSGEEPLIVNSQALKLAKIPPETPGLDKDPKTGEPTGVLWGFAAGIIEYETLPEVPVEPRLPALKKAMREANSVGLTTVFTRSGGMAISAIKELWAKGELTLRWRFSHELIRMSDKAEAILRRVGNIDGLGDDWLKIAGLQPGNPDSNLGGGSLTWKPPLRELPNSPSEGQLQQGWTPYGKNYWNDLEHSGYGHILLANRYGWRITGIHSAGDRANSMLLEAYAKANEERSIVGRRFSIDHGPMITQEHIQLIKKLGVIPSIAPKYVFTDPTNLVYVYGGDAVDRMSKVKSLIDAGIKPVAEADITGKYMAPLWNIQKFVTRKDEKGRVWGASEKVSRRDALYMYTSWAAAYLAPGEENKLGSIEPGKLADVVVMDRDFLTVPDEELSKLQITMTIVGGKVVYDRERDGAVSLPARER